VNDISKDLSGLKDVDLRMHRYFSLGVLLSSIVLFFSTMAPTTSFWDCGEFIACSYSMGVPHPPGAPFYLILGRFFTLILAFIPDVGIRVNALSALLSAFTVLLTYLITVRLIRRWRGVEKTFEEKLVLYGSGAIGALAFATSHSFWFNAVEAEVYAISMFFTAVVFWLAVRWMDEADSKGATKYLLMIAYMVGLSTGVHLLNVLAVSPIILLIYFQKYKFTWRGFILATAISFMAILVVYPGIVAGVPKMLAAGMWLRVSVLIILIAGTVFAIRKRKHIVSLALSSVLLVLIGYSTYTVIYIRSNLDPEINENQPDTVERLISYLNREQYGAVGPVEVHDVSRGSMSRLKRSGAKFISLGGGKVLRFHILERKADFWDYQINQMYVRYLSWQYFIGESRQILIFPFLIGLFGMVWHFWRDPKRGVGVGMLFLMTGIAIVFYLNQDNPQPRERDYAYVGSFFAFAIWIGIGVTAVVEFIEDLFRDKGKVPVRPIALGTVGLLALLIPVNMLVQNFESHSRRGNYVAWDYSHNMLESCEEGAILFTNGDNDTFPLWYLQVVEGIRRDVRVVNLSLLNTNWYIKQLRDKEPPVPVSFSDKDIDQKLTGRSDESLLLRYWPENQRDWKLKTPDGGTMEWKVPASLHIPTGLPGERPGEPNFLRVQDIMILHILEENGWKKPIYFAVTVSKSNLMGLDRYLSMEGLVFKLHSEKVNAINEEKLRENVFNTYRENYRNLNNPDVYFFQNITKLLQNYRSGFLQLVYEYYREAQETGMFANVPVEVSTSGIPEEEWEDQFEQLTPREKALFTLNTMDELIPPEVIPLSNREVTLQIGRIYYDLDQPEMGQKYIDHALEQLHGNHEGILQVAYYFAEHAGNPERAIELIDGLLEDKPSTTVLFNIAAILERMKNVEKSEEVLNILSMKTDLTLRDQLDLASYYYSTENWDRAAAIYESLLESSEKGGEIFGGLLSVYQAKQDTANVLRVLDQWLEINPNDKNAGELLEEWSKK